LFLGVGVEAFYSGLRDEAVDLDNNLRGQLTAAAVEVLLIDAGYQVIPTGIERSLRELRALSVDRYLDLAPAQLRTIPDFFVLDPKAEQSWLVEVKFRHYLHENLPKDLEAVQKIWAPFVLILVLEEPPKQWTGEVKHIRVFHINPEDNLTPAFFQEYDERLQDVFRLLRDKWTDSTILTVQDACLRLVGEGN
jgi:hypothetical protein